MSKKWILMMGAAALVLQASPVLADNHGGKHHGKMFEKHDTNGDGVISKEEFLSHAEDRFSKMDTDGDGSVTKEEGEAAKAKMKEKWKEKREKMKERKDATESDSGESSDE